MKRSLATFLRVIPAVIALALLLPAGCQRGSQGVLRLATTTSVRDSGLLNELLPHFERENNCRVDVIAVGTGAALKLGEAGDADVVLVHARDAEDAFLAAGHGTRREEFMVNHFVLLGPPDDPAGVRGSDPAEALRKIARADQRFVSRGDDSGTHKREQALWQAAGGRPEWQGYVESGQGMGATLVMADEKHAYTLADQGTYLKFKKKIDLVSLLPPSPRLRNPYSVIAVNPQRHKGVNARLAGAFIEFLIAPATQRRIAEYKVAGQQLFRPTRLADEP
jgi:tungstate transport system substrate-binding protein